MLWQRKKQQVSNSPTSSTMFINARDLSSRKTMKLVHPDDIFLPCDTSAKVGCVLCWVRSDMAALENEHALALNSDGCVFFYSDIKEASRVCEDYLRRHCPPAGWAGLIPRIVCLQQ